MSTVTVKKKKKTWFGECFLDFLSIFDLIGDKIFLIHHYCAIVNSRVACLFLVFLIFLDDK